MTTLSDALLALADDLHKWPSPSELRALAAQAQELERDAARYRWLRRRLPGEVDKWNLTRLAAGLSAGDAELDAAIDKERGNDK